MERLIFVFALVLSLVTSAPISNSTTNNGTCEFGVDAAKESSKAISNLAVKLYRQIAEPNKNVIFSPVSIALALALVESGADGGTKAEIEALLNPSGSNGGDSSALYQSLQHQLQIRTENARMSIANGLFYSEKLRLKSDYVENMQRCFETQIVEEPFGTQAEVARGRINKWISNATAEKIPELFKEGTIDESTMAVLANAIYMNAPWAKKFPGSEQIQFYQNGKDDQGKKVAFITKQDSYGYASSDSYDAVSIPYDQVPLSMYVVLPKQRNGLAAIEKDLKGDQLISLFGQTQREEVTLKLPKFIMRQGVDLKSVLGKLGLKQMFSDGANFSRMAEDSLKVSSAVHEAYIKVNENGTEAAAATGFGFVLVSALEPPPQPISFVADHPFLFFIVHQPTAAIAFMGRVESVDSPPTGGRMFG